mgnify:CR=1 FL=1
MQTLVQFTAEPNMAAADQTGTVGAAAITLKSLLAAGDLHADTNFVRLGVETDEIRYTVAGATPTATLGTKITPGSQKLLSRAEADNCKLIRVTADARVQIIQYRN